MKCLRKYKWLKLYRACLPSGRGIMGYWAKLASRAAFLKGYGMYCGFRNPVEPGMWAGGIVGLKSILGVKRRQKALWIMHELEDLGYLKFTHDQKTKKVTYQICDWEQACSGSECERGAVYAIMDYNKVFELGPWPINLLLYIFEEDDWDVLKKKLPADYHGTLEYMLLTRFGQRPAEIVRMVFEEGLSVYDVAARFDRDFDDTNRMIETQVKRLRIPFYSWFLLHGVSGEKLRAQAHSEKAGYGEGYYDGYQAALRDMSMNELDKYGQSHSNPEVLLTGELNIYVSDLRITMRTHNILVRAGYKSALELTRLPFDDLLKINGVRISTAKEIAKALREAGFVYYGGEE